MPNFLLAAILMLGLLPALQAQTSEWEKLPPMPEPNGGFMAGVSGKRLVIAGGTHWAGGKKNWLSAIHEFDPATKTWSKVKDLERPVAYGVPYQVRVGGSREWQTGFVGGSDGLRPSKSRVILDGVKSTCSTPFDGLPDAMVLCAGGQVNNTFIMVGGTDDAGNLGGMTNRAHALVNETDGTRVVRLPDHPGQPSGVAACAVSGDELFVFGGVTPGPDGKSPVNLDQAYAYSTQTQAWRKLKPLPVKARGMTAVTLTPGRIYIAGGYRSDPEEFTAEAWVYDVAKDDYHRALALPYKASVGLILCEGHVYCLGGEDQMKSRTDACYRIPFELLMK